MAIFTLLRSELVLKPSLLPLSLIQSKLLGYSKKLSMMKQSLLLSSEKVTRQQGDAGVHIYETRCIHQGSQSGKRITGTSFTAKCVRYDDKRFDKAVHNLADGDRLKITSGRVTQSIQKVSVWECF